MRNNTNKLEYKEFTTYPSFRLKKSNPTPLLQRMQVCKNFFICDHELGHIWDLNIEWPQVNSKTFLLN